jgi:hypothetical protein
MARTQTLTLMVANLRAECGHSLSVAQGQNTQQTLQYILARTQEELWTAFVWPELMFRDDIAMSPGLATYSYSTNVKFDMIREAWAASSSSGHWSKVTYGIGEDKLVPGTGANTTSADPVFSWEANSSGFQVWPTPVVGGWLRFKGNRELQPLVATSDSCTLDATCIILFAAAELLARAKAEDAANKLQKAQRHLAKLQGNQVSAKNKVSTMGTGAPNPNQYGGVVGHTVIIGWP